MNKKDTQKQEDSREQISTRPYKGARDIYPEEMRVQNYIFDTWQKVCKRYGFEEYTFPIIERFEIFAAKTGEEIVKNQMFNLTDGAGRKLAIRPELTPGTVRVITEKFYEIEKPIKWFMIGNNWRYEKPQKGRGREFNQLEVNTFGMKSVLADFEIFQLIVSLMREFGAKKDQFTLEYSDRKVIYALLRDTLKYNDDKQIEVRRIMDKRAKVNKKEFAQMLKKVGVKEDEIEKIEDFMNSTLNSLNTAIPENILKGNQGYKDLIELQSLLRKYEIDKYCKFSPSIIRGFDYSDGIVYEVFDNNPKNSRSMFGGERFDGLVEIFGDYELPATGFAMGDYTLTEFLKGWKLLPKLGIETKVLITVFDKNCRDYSLQIGEKLRNEGINTFMYLEDKKLDKQLKYADKKNIPFVIIAGPDEIKNGTVMLKDMGKEEQKEMELEKAIQRLED